MSSYKQHIFHKQYIGGRQHIGSRQHIGGRQHRPTALMLSLVVFVCSLTFCTTGCGTTLTTPVSVTGYKLNTYVSVKAYTTGGHTTSKLNQILNDALAMCDYYELLFSRTNTESTLYRLNHNETTTIPSELAELILEGIRYSELSDGLFDITIGSVSSLWDFTAVNPVVPSEQSIATALQSVGYAKLSLTDNSDGTYTLTKPDGLMIDLGAIAKGYIADRIKTFLLENNINNAIIDLGGNILCVGRKSADASFNIGIKKPFTESGEILSKLSLDDVSAVSSGNYERYFTKDNALYHHILNPKTGYPVDNDLTNVTIISADSLTGDCLSTTCYSLGLDAGLSLINSMDGVEAMFVTTDGKIHYSDNFSLYMTQ